MSHNQPRTTHRPSSKLAASLGLALCAALALLPQGASAQVTPGLETALPISAFVEPQGVDVIVSETLVADQLNFAPNQSRIPSEQRFILDGLVDLMRQDPSLRLTLMGHADPAENNASTVSLQRAQQVEAMLVKLGLDDERVEPKGFGATQPVSEARGDAGLNRRVEFKLFKEIRFQEEVKFQPQSATPSTTEPLESVAQRLQDNKFVRLRIVGYADVSEGRERADFDRLSLERADQVRRALVARGVSPQRLSIIGAGEKTQRAPADHDNRRVAFQIVVP
jgi:outer membrane protein OmpA-like peptidoglycan-associated protein